MSSDRKELEKVWPLVARVAVGALAGKGLLESQRTSPVQKVAPFTPSRKRHDDALGSGPAVEKTFHDDIDTGVGMADAAKVAGSALLGAYLGGKLGRKLGRGAGGLADAFKRAQKKSVPMTKQPSGPPRPGLQWKPSTSRWIRPAESTGASYKPSYDYERPTTDWIADPKRSSSEIARTISELDQERKDLNGEIKELGRQLHHDMTVYELTDYSREANKTNMKKLKELRDRLSEVEDHHHLARSVEAFRLAGEGFPKRNPKRGAERHRVRKTVDYQQATTWPQQKSIAGDIGSRVGRTAGEAVGKKFSKQGNPFAIATSQAKKMGYDDFSEGSTGRKKRGKIAEAVKGIDNMNKSNDPMTRLFKAVEGLKEGFIDGGQSGKPYTDSSENIDTPKKKSELLPKDSKPPEGYMLKKECTCHE